MQADGLLPGSGASAGSAGARCAGSPVRGTAVFEKLIHQTPVIQAKKAHPPASSSAFLLRTSAGLQREVCRRGRWSSRIAS